MSSFDMGLCMYYNIQQQSTDPLATTNLLLVWLWANFDKLYSHTLHSSLSNVSWNNVRTGVWIVTWSVVQWLSATNSLSTLMPCRAPNSCLPPYRKNFCPLPCFCFHCMSFTFFHFPSQWSFFICRHREGARKGGGGTRGGLALWALEWVVMLSCNAGWVFCHSWDKKTVYSSSS